MSKEVLERIASTGLNGMKKAELKKTFGKNCDNILQKLIDTEQIFIEKKGVAYFVWTRDNYVSYLSQNDPKCKIVLSMAMGKSHSSAKVKEYANNIGETVNEIPQQNVASQASDFKVEFDRRLTESSISIGWAPFSDIRKKICESKKISPENFYSMATELVERHREKYEVSSGGQEGIIMRGLVHGYVRNV
ncbi:MAG: hypothetical protein HY222_00265 [Thaumarchaeota archaeon]|nr:hypothetical protein [Nitrososphaerota archaeon]MBI3640823.1 hypothetical protein [Nitrososphaerota archaeon]